MKNTKKETGGLPRYNCTAFFLSYFVEPCTQDTVPYSNPTYTFLFCAVSTPYSMEWWGVISHSLVYWIDF